MSFLEQVEMHKDLADAMSSWAQVAALGAGSLGIFKYFSEKRVDRQSGARTLYTDFMKYSVEHPDMYGDAWADGSLTSKSLIQKYTYYVGYFLWAAEEILREFPQESAWIDTLKITLREHSDYLKSPEFAAEESGYSSALRDLIKETI